MLRPRSHPYAWIWALPASLPRTRPSHPPDEASFRNEFESALALVRLEPRPDRLLVEELREPLLAAALAVEELRLLDLRVQVVLGRVPAHRLGMLEAELGSAQDDRVLLQQLARERLHLATQHRQRRAPV